MKKALIVSAIVAAALFAAGAAFAHRNGYGPGYGRGYDPDCYGYVSGRDVNVESMKKFQKETLSLRDDLTSKILELQAECGKRAPDSARIESLGQDIVGLRLKIRAVANKYGIAAGGYGRGRAPGMRHEEARAYGCAWR